MKLEVNQGITKEGLRENFASGVIVNQDRYAPQEEIEWIDDLIAEGAAQVIVPWVEHRVIAGVRKVAQAVQEQPQKPESKFKTFLKGLKWKL